MARQARPIGLARKFGARVRALREEAGLTQEKLAWAADVGKGFLSEIESGKRFPSLPTMAKIAARLGVEMADLFVLDADNPRLSLLDAARRRDPESFRKLARRLGLE